MTEHKLVSCPFCGGDASVVEDGGNEVWNQSWHVGCTKCSVQFKEYGSNSWASDAKVDALALAQAVARWNTRAPQENCRTTTAGLKDVEPRVTGTRMDYTANNQVDARRSSGIL